MFLDKDVIYLTVKSNNKEFSLRYIDIEINTLTHGSKIIKLHSLFFANLILVLQHIFINVFYLSHVSVY